MQTSFVFRSRWLKRVAPGAFALATILAGCAGSNAPSNETIEDQGDLIVTENENDKVGFDFFVAKGLTSAQAAGIVGNLDQESSGMDPTSVQQGGGPGRGIAQWGVGQRWDTYSQDNVQWYAEAKGEGLYSLDLQLEFIWYELTTFSYYGLSDLKGATNPTDPTDAVLAFMQDYEGCDPSQCNPSNRIAHAKAALADFGSHASTPAFVYALRANGGQFVSSQGGPAMPAMGVVANRATVGAWEAFRVIPVSGGYAIQCEGAWAPQYYVSAEGGGGGDVHCNRTKVGPWETFRLEWSSSTEVAFRTSNGHYLSAQSGGGFGVDARGTALGPWETFAVSAPGVASGKCSAAEYQEQNVSGTSYWVCQGNSRYICDGYDDKVVESCPSGCQVSGSRTVDDQCSGTAQPQCTETEYEQQNVNGTSYWTCQGNSRYVCDGQRNKVTEWCSQGCEPAGYAADDSCR